MQSNPLNQNFFYQKMYKIWNATELTRVVLLRQLCQLDLYYSNKLQFQRPSTTTT